MCCLRTVHANNALQPTFAGANAAELKRWASQAWRETLRGGVTGFAKMSTTFTIARRTRTNTSAFSSTWPATEDDVKSGMAPEAGDILSAMELLIGFCPFCGIKLPAAN